MPEGHTIHRLARRHARLLTGAPAYVESPQGRFAEGAALVSGSEVVGTDAWGKHLFHEYAGGRLVHVHLGLFGRFRDGRLPAPEPRGAVRMRVTGESHWLELRGPITCEVLTPTERDAVTARLGPDPLRDDSSAERVLANLVRRRTGIGALLMDQCVVAGIGNVYRAEILFRHGLSPWLPGRLVDESSWGVLWEDLRVLMHAGVRSGRIVTTRPEDRAPGEGRVRQTDAYYVYRREGRPCRLCGTPVRRTTWGGRNLFWCPTCQPDP
ncbi:endonuclease VIII [Marmoricola endophyticus]|uniref:DNA-(apurinic or apyrimidinic site) lyase n=1 Tax=Marmoricola endophyticus TaxID=2040280 RepID=A0A917F9K2_9ACTN|nr:Fpg/Nei family DNA glycosylase [Marmoricola endophyticus]GGF55714.1 endonuclease VIII [Marmoricola endophyticus]